MDVASNRDFLFNPDIVTNFLQHNYIAPLIVVVYILFTTVLGPIIMREQKPMNLKYIILFYNFALVASNVYFFVQFISLAWTIWPVRCNLKYQPYFNEFFKSYQPEGFLCLLSRFAELFDTVFFVLRKKFNQITFLHVFHHSIVFYMAWYIMKTKEIGYYLLVLGTLNTFVHIIMYSYYTMAALGPQMRKYLWWKKYLTTIQIAQFLLLLTYLGINLLTGCETVGVVEKISFGGTVIVMILFFNFYYKAYKK